ncbi:MAG: PDZ domain-containing protein [Candidatus Acidiferrales bacterium]
MMGSFDRKRILLAFLLPLVLSGASRAHAANEPLHYELKFEAPNTHLMDVTIHATGLDGKSVDFAIPDWAPGSYYIENYWMNVEGFHAVGPDVQALAWRKIDEQTWRIDLNRATSVMVSYQVYGNTLQNNRAQYNEKHAFVGGPSLWMYMVNGKDRPIELNIAVPSGWKVATGMTRRDGSHFSATNYDWFADAPLEISDFKEKTFEFGGAKYHIVYHDIENHKDTTQFAADAQKIVETIVPMMSSVAGTPQQQSPFQEYWFLFHIWPKTGGGLEHLNSTQIDFPTDWDSKAPARDFGSQYELKLFVTAHEFFHAWNVKRLRPKPLGPFDYAHQVHTPSLWISEGLTSYYGSLALVRAGLITPQAYLDEIAKLITKFEQVPGRKERSIEDTSWDTWYVRNPQGPENNLSNTNYSYYDGGQIVGHLLDFAIRQNTRNQKSLDDWMRLMYSRYALPKPGFEPNDAITAMSEVAGMDMSDFVRRYISGKEPLPYEAYFAYAGIAVEKKVDPTRSWLGTSSTNTDDGRAKISNIIPGSPAETAGLQKDDIVLGIDGRVVTPDDLDDAVAAHKPGDSVKVTVIRLGEIRDFPVTIGSNPFATYTLKPVDDPTGLQQQIYKSWLGIK